MKVVPLIVGPQDTYVGEYDAQVVAVPMEVLDSFVALMDNGSLTTALSIAEHVIRLTDIDAVVLYDGSIVRIREE